MQRRFVVGLIVVSMLLAGAVAALAEELPPGGTFVDDDGNVHEGNIEAIAADGITRGCNPPLNTRYCPGDSVTRGQMAAFLVRALDLPGSSTDFFDDDDDSIFEADIQALRLAGITLGCNPPTNDRYCPGATVTRGQMAAFLARAFDYPATGTDFFDDDDGSIFEADINAIAQAGVTRGCNPPANDEYCVDAPVDRDQMASFLARALGLPPIPVPTLSEGAVDYFVSIEEICIAWADTFDNPAPNPDRFLDVAAVEQITGERVLVEDGTGGEWIVDFGGDPTGTYTEYGTVVYSSSGPTAALPLDMSFGCPPSLVIGAAID